MKENFIPYQTVISSASLWRDAGGLCSAELGALEPLLWHEGDKDIVDLVSGLARIDFSVGLTTNGQKLKCFSSRLSQAGLSKLRISWHTTNPDFFREISGGHGIYQDFLTGIQSAAYANVPLTFNRVLLRGYTDDIPEQLKFISETNSQLKLYDLMWTPQIATVHRDLYTDIQSVVNKYVLPLCSHVSTIQSDIGRSRQIYHLDRGGSVEVKLNETADRNSQPCLNCQFNKVCLEGFGDYARVDPSGHFYFCYMRRDIGFDILPHLLNREGSSDFKDQVLSHAAPHGESIFKNTALRFTVSGYCNFNCRVPGTRISWCMEEPNEKYVFPPIKSPDIKFRGWPR